MIGACPDHLLNSACRRSAPSIKQRSNLILSGSGSSARRYSSQLASQRHLHLPSAITLTAVSSIGLSPGQPSPCSLISRSVGTEGMRGLPPPPLIMRWSKSPVERGTARACLELSREELLPTISSRDRTSTGWREGQGNLRRYRKSQTPLPIHWFQPGVLGTSIQQSSCTNAGIGQRLAFERGQRNEEPTATTRS